MPMNYIKMEITCATDAVQDWINKYQSREVLEFDSKKYTICGFGYCMETCYYTVLELHLSPYVKPKSIEQIILEQAIKDCDNVIEHKQLMKQKYEQQLKELENE